MPNSKVDAYLANGCGRCDKGGTPDCKVHLWANELLLLRKLLFDCGLNEDLKWSHPCYTFNNKNIAILGAFKDHCVLTFPKGALLKDPNKLLEKPGENTQAARRLCFKDTAKIIANQANIERLIREAIEVENSSQKVKFKKTADYEIPAELQEKFNQDHEYQRAFESLTPGRQRGYLLHFSTPKQSATKINRIENSKERILLGKGFNER